MTDLAAARAHAGTIVVDNLSELRRLNDLKGEDMPSADRSAGPPNVWLRLQPGLAVATHHSHTQTGQHGSKFGMTSEELIEARRICKEKGLPLNGLAFPPRIELP